MRVKHLLEHFGRPVLYGLAGWALGGPLSSQAANANVGVSNASNALAFFPGAVTINVGDQVTWTWAGTVAHSTTDTGVWDSGLKTGSPNTFSHTFSAAGTYPYFCSLHAGLGMTGSVTVQGGNVPPSVTITSPTNGATFAAPWTGIIQATASDTDGTVAKVDFFAGATLLGTVNNPPANPSLTVTNLAAGSYTLTAVATDNGGATNTSARVGIAVVTPVPIVLSSPQRLSASAVQFTYSANPGLSYVVLRSEALPTFAPITTNTAAGSTVTYVDNSAAGPVNFYRVLLAPNP
jgi:plastocyanin